MSQRQYQYRAPQNSQYYPHGQQQNYTQGCQQPDYSAYNEFPGQYNFGASHFPQPYLGEPNQSPFVVQKNKPMIRDQAAEAQVCKMQILQMNNNVMALLEQIDYQMNNKTHASNIPVQTKKLNLYFAQVQDFLQALCEDETEETQVECSKLIKDMINQNRNVAKFDFPEVSNQFEIYTKVLQGQEDQIPLKYNPDINQLAIIKGVQMYVNEQERNNQLRKQCHDNPDLDVCMEDFREVAKRNVQTIDEHINKGLKKNQNQGLQQQAARQNQRRSVGLEALPHFGEKEFDYKDHGKKNEKSMGFGKSIAEVFTCKNPFRKK